MGNLETEIEMRIEKQLLASERAARMRLRDEIAMAALPALIEKLNYQGLYREECKGDSINLGVAAYKIADGMLKARESHNNG